MRLDYWHLKLTKLRDELSEITGEWNGEDSGYKEDNAHIAEDSIEKVDELLEFIKELT